jgi:hypothetical protein
VVDDTLIIAAAKLMAKVMVGDKEIDCVPMPNNTVHRRITDMAENIKQQLLL